MNINLEKLNVIYAYVKSRDGEEYVILKSDNHLIYKGGKYTGIAFVVKPTINERTKL